MNSQELCDQLCSRAEPAEHAAIRRAIFIGDDSPTEEDLDIAADLLVAAALEGRSWAIQEIGWALDD